MSPPQFVNHTKHRDFPVAPDLNPCQSVGTDGKRFAPDWQPWAAVMAKHKTRSRLVALSAEKLLTTGNQRAADVCGSVYPIRLLMVYMELRKPAPIPAIFFFFYCNSPLYTQNQTEAILVISRFPHYSTLQPPQ